MDANMLQALWHLEASVDSLVALKERRRADLLEMTSSIERLHQRLYEVPPEKLGTAPEAPGALCLEALADTRRRLGALETIEQERLSSIEAGSANLQAAWDSLGLRVPDDLEEQEKAFLQEPPPISDACLAYLASRRGELETWCSKLKLQENSLRVELAELQHRVSPFSLSLPTIPERLPLLRQVRVLEVAVHDLQRTAEEFVQQQRTELTAFYETSRLPNVSEVLSMLESAHGLRDALHVLASQWDGISAQRAEHHRISNLIADREALEAEMCAFDVEASDPLRFKKRGYSGVQENRRRADYQRQLRMLDASLSASKVDWHQHEGMPFFLEGVEYRVAEILSAEHTHMYACMHRT